MHITLAGSGFQRNIEMCLWVLDGTGKGLAAGINVALAMLYLFFWSQNFDPMRSTFTLVIFYWSLVACGRTNRPAEKPADPQPPVETPKALEDHSSLLSKSRGSEDLVESLYLELVKNDPRLTELESRLDQLSDHHGDSIKPFDSYDYKNNAYYSSAREHIKNMKDSALRGKMEQLIAASDTAYQALTANHHALLAGIDKKALTVEDLHTMLKLTRTANVIGQYQKGHLPGTGPLQRLLKEYERAGEKTMEMVER